MIRFKSLFFSKAVVLLQVILLQVLLQFTFQTQIQAQSLIGPVQFFYSPNQDAHQPLIDAISGSNYSINMVMYHLSDPTVGSALMFAAKRGVQVRILFDRGEWKNPHDSQLVTDMQNAGVQLVPASAAFRITHEKAAVFDNRIAMISTMNQIRNYMSMFDMGILTTDQNVIAEFNQVFEADWQNAASNGQYTPPLANANLVWSPVNSEAKLVNLINRAIYRIELTSENMGDAHVQNALMDAASRGVAVRVLVPMCDAGVSNFNYPFVMALRQARVDARMMPGPASPSAPYIHAKSIIIDQKIAYLGSENFSTSSLTLSREVGVIDENPYLAVDIDNLFESLWALASLPPVNANYSCAAFITVPAANGDGSGSSGNGFNSIFESLNRLMIHPSLH